MEGSLHHRWPAAVNVRAPRPRGGRSTIAGGTGSQTGATFYAAAMAKIIITLLVINMLAVLGVLLAGFVGVARGASPARSNQLMRWRIILQASAICLFVLLMIFR